MGPENRSVAEALREVATLLEQQGANPFRVSAYRRGADTVAKLDRDLRDLFDVEGERGLEALPNIGKGLARAIAEMLHTGRCRLVERLRGQAAPEGLFHVIPGIGPELSQRLHDELHVDTLETLEVAAHDGRLERVPGIGPRRAAGIRAGLAELLGRRFSQPRDESQVGVEVLLEVDRQYRELAEADRLPRIAPRRFNPTGEKWLPILHTDRRGWHFTALYSNTARAHDLGKTRDWVVIYVYDDHHREGQVTVVTEPRGPLIGLRVVRGRERETADYYRGQASEGLRRTRRRAGERPGPAHPRTCPGRRVTS